MGVSRMSEDGTGSGSNEAGQSASTDVTGKKRKKEKMTGHEM